MCIYFGYIYRTVSKHGLNIAYVNVFFEKLRGKSMTEHMWCNMVVDVSNSTIFIDHISYRLIRQTISSIVYKEMSACPQENIKNEILKNIADGKRTIWGITGGAGTGKTLLLYDIAKQLSNDKKVCIIHSGMLAKGHKFIGEKITNIDVISARDCNLEKILEYDCILVDESQRLYEIDFNSVITAFKNFNRICIFAYDFYQVLSWKEEKLNIPDKLRSLDCFCEKHITEKIRTNKEIVSFIKHAIYLKNKPDDNIKYDCIDILYAIDYECATSIIEHYVYNKGYEFIAYTPSRVSSVLDYFKGYKNTHEVIGQEFDNVIFNMDDNFQYAEDGHLQGKMHPNPNYIFYKLWFQGVSRAREKLCILVIGNEELFKKLLSVKNKFK